jgi:hypothetical protein
MWDVFLLTKFSPVSHQILDIGDMSRGDSFPSSSIAPASSTPPSISFHMLHKPRKPRDPAPKRVNPLGKKCHIDGADHAITLITVKSSIEILDSPSQRSKRSESSYPVRLAAGSTQPHRTISLLETKLDDHPVLLKYLKAATFCDVSNAAIYS